MAIGYLVQAGFIFVSHGAIRYPGLAFLVASGNPIGGASGSESEIMVKKLLAPALTLLTWLVLSACAISGGTPTPTIVPLDRSATEQSHSQFDDAPPTATRLPFPSPTPTRTPLPVSEISLLSTPAPAPTMPPAAVQAEVIVSALNIRQGPGVEYPAIDTAFAGDEFAVVGVDSAGDWLQVARNDGGLGWISGQSAYTRIVGSLDDVPVAQASPLPEPGPTASRIGGVSRAGGLDGKLVFMTGSGGDLYIINVDGTNLRRLTGGVIDPVLSPDGRQVAFTRWDGAEVGTLYTINLDGSGERAIAGDILQAKSPAWSPDGQSIIVSFQRGGLRDPEEECREFDFDDTIRLPKDIAKITKSRVSADGIVICYIRLRDLRWGLRQVDVATGQFEDMPADEYSYTPAWDPQNPWRVIFDGNKGLVQLDVTNGSRWPITTDLRDTGPVFSPDGETLALTYKQHDHWEVYTLDLAASARKRLTKPPILADPQYNSAAPAWSPDGADIAFVTDRTGQWEIWVMNADGSDQRPLFPAEIQTRLGLQYRGVYERMLNWTD